MPDFIITTSNSKFKTSESIKKKWKYICNKNTHLYYNSRGYKEIKLANKTVHFIGDFIFRDNRPDLSSPKSIIKNVKGCYYCIIISDSCISVFSSFLNLLPIYYSDIQGTCSTNMAYFVPVSENQINKKFILESLLFHYPFSNRTINSEVSLLPTHNELIIKKDSQFKINSFLNIEDLYPSNINSTKKYRNYLSDKFISLSKLYFPEEKSAITFTSGFDGRTLVSCGLYHKKDFLTLSFGDKTNPDVTIPQKQASILNLEYKAYDAHNKKYVNEGFEQSGNELVLRSGGYNGFIYPHFLHLSQQIKEKSSFLLTGYGGSELFRAVHLSGGISSKALYNLFTFKNHSLLRKNILNDSGIDILNLDLFKIEFDELLEEIISYKENLSRSFSKNEALYYYVFNEILRKVFGFWLSGQSQYLNVRNPFLDFEFVKDILQSNIAGINNDFNTENPIKRFKGQLLYGEIIKKTNPVIYEMPTGKGYSPKALVEPLGIFKIIMPFITKRLNRKVQPVYLNNLGIISGFNSIKQSFNKIKYPDFFNETSVKNKISLINNYCSEQDRDQIMHAYSILKYLNYEKTNSIS